MPKSELPRTGKNRDPKKTEMNPKKETPGRKGKGHEGLPGSHVGQAQDDFMKPERADRDSNIRSGAL